MKSIIIAVSLCCTQALWAHHGAYTAYAVPLADITIDGNLEEWPDGLPQYPILTNGRVYGATDIDHADLRVSDDLSAAFRIGYDPKNDVLYLAIRVKDDAAVADRFQVFVRGTESHMVLDSCDLRTAPNRPEGSECKLHHRCCTAASQGVRS